eukprot:TRINITY_DN2831_c0_g5_i1.p2 TRINITY_DN2831_c0_g5~~TRINITY_DN2831_c0_g5_i1.p2  ORF type:complete len:220 (-),score=37.12 TRINITY_DN2831_c0_g5_i1:1095-1754(-)
MLPKITREAVLDIVLSAKKAPVLCVDTTASLVILGNICTMQGGLKKPHWVEAIAVNDGIIVYCGTEEGVKSYIDCNTEVINTGEGMCLPGFQDAHVHALAGATKEFQCNVSLCKSLEEALIQIRTYVESNPKLCWIKGFGFSPSWFGDSVPSASVLDSCTKGKPASFYCFDGHSMWVNTEAMKIAGVTKTSPDPPGGIIQRDEKGDPVGFFFRKCCIHI